MSESFRMTDGFKHRHNSSELSVELTCDTSDPYNYFSDNLSPIAASAIPRKLDFTHLDDEDVPKDASVAPVSFSPPYRRVRALRLFDSPHTPKTLIEKCSTPSHPHSRTRLFPPRFNVPSEMPSGSSHHLHPPSDDDSALGSLLEGDATMPRPSRLTLPAANINPFTPDGQALNKKKRALSKTPTWDSSPVQPTKRLRESNISRYNIEFVELGVIGSGEFGRVTKCVNKLDGCVYAIKRSLRPVAGSAAERAALTEVYAHAALGNHPHVVRYYSAWAEDDHMVIQNEYCAGGALGQALAAGPLPEPELRLLLAHVARGLAYIHSLQLVHMDVKPGNIFIAHGDATGLDSDSDEDTGSEEQVHKPRNIYKIGDLGHVTCAWSTTVEEGDCRYLPREILNDCTHLTKADIFSFGLTLWEAAGGGPLPRNGPEWHSIRDGRLPDLAHLSDDFNRLLKEMVHPDPEKRPSATQLKRHPLARSAVEDSARRTAEREGGAEALRRELAATNLRNELLARKLDEVVRCMKALSPSVQVNESAKFRTRAAKRLHSDHGAHRRQKAKVDAQLAEMIQSVTSPLQDCRKRRSKKH